MRRKLGDGINCFKCGKELASDPFYSSGELQSQCNECRKAYLRGLYKDDDGSKLRSVNLRKRFGMSLDDYGELFESQNGVCAICKQECEIGKNLSVDHDHVTKEIRGLLCRKCNMAVGLLNEDPILIQEMYNYLERTTWSKGTEFLKIGPKFQDFTYKDDTRGLEWLS